MLKEVFQKIKICLSTKDRYYHLCLVRGVKIQPDTEDNTDFEYVATET